MKQHKKLSLTLKIFIALALGSIVGFLINKISGGSKSILLPLGFTTLNLYSFLVEQVFYIGGQIFINSLKMMVVPLVFVSLVCGTSNLKDTAALGRLGGKTFGLYLITTAIAISIAMALAMIVQPGVGVTGVEAASHQIATPPPFSQVLIDIIPSNPISAMANANMLQVIVFALLLGISMSLSGERGARLAAMFEDLNEVLLKLVTILMNLAPYGVFFLMAKLFATFEVDVITKLGKYFVTVLAALFIHGLLTYPLMLSLIARLNPLVFLRKMREAVMFAFSTSSSSATLPVTLETVTQKLGVNNNVASFTVPLGATINMDGTAIMQGVATVFIAQFYGIDLTAADLLLVVLTATMASIGTAGVPGVGLIMLAMVLQQVGLPVEGIALIIGVDRLLDMTRTAVNITGDCVVSCIVGKSEKQFNEQVYLDPNAGQYAEEHPLNNTSTHQG